MSDPGLTIYDCEQGSEAWFQCRRGIPTASEFSTLLGQGRTKGSPSVTRRKYLLKTIGEQMGATPPEAYTNAAMERGHAMEAEARNLYAMVTGNQPQLVGFMRRTLPGGDAGASPDGLIGEDGLLEIKTAEPHIQLERLLDGVLPPEHKAQCQGALLISGRSWIDFVSFWPALPILIVREYPDPDYMAKLTIAIEDFHRDISDLKAAILAL